MHACSDLSAERVSRCMHVLVRIDGARSVWWCYSLFNRSVLPRIRVLAGRVSAAKLRATRIDGAIPARSPFYSRGTRTRAVNNGQDAALVAPGHVLAE